MLCWGLLNASKRKQKRMNNTKSFIKNKEKFSRKWWTDCRMVTHKTMKALKRALQKKKKKIIPYEKLLKVFQFMRQYNFKKMFLNLNKNFNYFEYCFEGRIVSVYRNSLTVSTSSLTTGGSFLILDYSWWPWIVCYCRNPVIHINFVRLNNLNIEVVDEL